MAENLLNALSGDANGPRIKFVAKISKETFHASLPDVLWRRPVQLKARRIASVVSP
jgi:hypothetical protein